MKKKILLTLVLLLPLTFCACGKNNKNIQIMDRPAEDGKYHYSNADLAFSLVLPGDFEYYQTQRFNMGVYTDLEFHIPTSDKEYYQHVPGYGKFLTVRVYDKKEWDELDSEGFDRKSRVVIGEKNQKIFTVLFWTSHPKDWQEVWTGQMQEEIFDSIKIIK